MSDTPNPLKRFLIWLSGAPDSPPAPSPQPPEPAPEGAADLEPAAPEPWVEPTRAAPAGETAEAAVPTEAATSAVAATAEAQEKPTLAAADDQGLGVLPAAVAASASRANQQVVNDATAYGVAVELADVVPGTLYWQVVRVHHLTPEENHGNHHIYLDALDEAGERIMGAQARVTWEGGEQVITVDKPANEPGANFPMWKWQICQVEMLGLPSDRVVNLHTGHPDEPPGTGNTLFHHSFHVDFQRRLKAIDDLAQSVISGVVSNGAGRAISLLQDGATLTSAVADAGGAFRFEGLAAGTYVVALPDAGIRSDPLTVDGTNSVSVSLVVPDGGEPSDGKPLERYLLFGASESPATAVYLALARDALLTYRPTFGFNPVEATHAQSVAIVGEVRDVSQEVEDNLIAAGCQVERIQGTAEEIAAGLERVLNPGDPI